MHDTKHKTIYAFIIVIIILVLGAFASGVRSSQLDNVAGFAWGSDDWVDLDNDGVEDSGETMTEPGGMGWLSFNCISGGNCGASDYGVNVDTTTGDITGYAWSSNYGWLKFGGLTGFPTGPGTTSANAKVDFNTNEVTGWARFCAVAANPTTCIGFVPSLSNGGWDGWVSLRGTGPNYGVSLAGDEFTGYAWGGNDGGRNVVGWLSFNCISGGNCSVSDYKVTYNPIVDPVVTLQANPVSVPIGGTTTLSWNGLGLVNNSTGCTASGGAGGWAGARPSSSGSYTTTALSSGSYVFSISCEGAGGGVAVAEVTVNVGIQIDFYAEPNIAYPPAYQVTLHWNAVPNTPNGTLTSCEPTSSPSVSAWDNLNIADMPPAGSAVNIPVPLSPTRFTLTCTDGINDVTKDVYVNRGTLPESIAFSNTAVVEGPPGEYYTTLSWTTINMVTNSCVASNDNGDPLVNWNGAKNNPESGPSSEPNIRVLPVSPAFITYTITCTGLYSGSPVAVSLQLNENSGSGFNKVAPRYIER